MFGQLRPVLGHTSVSLHLVEVSPALSRLQAQNLTSDLSHEADTVDEPVYRRGETAEGLPVSWYRRLDDVPVGTVGQREAWSKLLISRTRTGGLSGGGPSHSQCLSPSQGSASLWLMSSSTLCPSTSSRLDQSLCGDCAHV